MPKLLQYKVDIKLVLHDIVLLCAVPDWEREDQSSLEVHPSRAVTRPQPSGVGCICLPIVRACPLARSRESCGSLRLSVR